MIVEIILGNRMNDDGTLSNLMVERLELGKIVYEKFKPDFIICSGGIANPVAGISEAYGQKEYLIKSGIDESKIILEDKSMTTLENALFSIPIARKLNATTIIVVSSIDHFTKRLYNVYELFHHALGNDEVELIFYTKNRKVVI